MLLIMAAKYAIQLVENMKRQKLHLTQRQISREVLVYFILHLQRRSWYVCNIYSEDVTLKPPPRELNSDTTHFQVSCSNCQNFTYVITSNSCQTVVIHNHMI